MNDYFFLSAPQLKRIPLGGNPVIVETSPGISWPRAVRMTFIWAVTGAICGAVTWAALMVLVDITRGPEFFLSVFIAGFYFGGFVAVVSVLPYWALLLAYVAFLARRPTIEQSTRRFLGVSLCLALPVSLVVFVSFLDPWSSFGPSWDTALLAGPFVLIAAWVGIVLPRLVIPALRPGRSWIAA